MRQRARRTTLPQAPQLLGSVITSGTVVDVAVAVMVVVGVVTVVTKLCTMC
jgi:hypothetical protein